MTWACDFVRRSSAPSRETCSTSSPEQARDVHHPALTRQLVGDPFGEIQHPHRHRRVHLFGVRDAGRHPHRAMRRHHPARFVGLDLDHARRGVGELIPVVRVPRLREVVRQRERERSSPRRCRPDAG